MNRPKLFILIVAMACMFLKASALHGDAVTIDGNIDAGYGSAVVVQNTQTGFGDNTLGQADYANGSELDACYALIADGNLYLFISGNLESNFNKLEIFLDTKSGGQNRLRGDNWPGDFGGLNRMGDSGSGDGLRFDTAFSADYWVGVTGGGSPYLLYANFAVINTGGGGPGWFLGSTSAASTGDLTGGDAGAPVIRCTINNNNIMGVGSGNGSLPPTGAGSGDGVTTGVELAIPLSVIGNPASAKCCIFINGSSHDFVSNQVLAGLNGGANLGEPRAVNFAANPNRQYFTVAPPPTLLIPWGDDCFITTCGQTSYGFSATPLPSGFFGPGSDPFVNVIQLGGPPGFPPGIDTTVRRLDQLVLPTPLPSTDVVPIELVSLNLVSCAPTTVTYNNGQSSEAWNVNVDLSIVPAPPGTMTTTRNAAAGGSFDAVFYVQPLFTFTNVSDPGITRVLDTGVAGIPPMLMTSIGVPWRSDFPGFTCSPGFAPGIAEGANGPCCVEICHRGPSPQHPHCVRPPYCQYLQCGDGCGNPFIIHTPGSYSGTTCPYTNDYDEVCPFYDSIAPDVVYSYTPSANTCVDLTMCFGSTNYDTKLYVWEGSCPGSVLACNDDACTNLPLFPNAWVSRLLNLNLIGGTTYYIVVDGYDVACGNYSLKIAPCLSCPTIQSDMNGDGLRNGRDVAAFIQCLMAGGPPYAVGCGCADTNGDHALTNADIANFVANLLG